MATIQLDIKEPTQEELEEIARTIPDGVIARMVRVVHLTILKAWANNLLDHIGACPDCRHKRACEQRAKWFEMLPKLVGDVQKDWQQRGRVSDIHVLHDPLITEALSALGEDDE